MISVPFELELVEFGILTPLHEVSKGMPSYKLRLTRGKAVVKEFESIIEVMLIKNFNCSHKKIFPFYPPSLDEGIYDPYDSQNRLLPNCILKSRLRDTIPLACS